MRMAPRTKGETPGARGVRGHRAVTKCTNPRLPSGGLVSADGQRDSESGTDAAKLARARGDVARALDVKLHA